jgi:hypothetical protein
MTTTQPMGTDVIDPGWDNANVRVLFIGGLGRSGSTLLDRSIGQLPGFWSLGEVVHIWRRGVVDNERCGCWEPFHSCTFWGEVGNLAFGGWDHVDGEQMLALQQTVDRFRYVPAMLHPWLRPGHRNALQEYREIILRLYRAVQALTGASVLIDSTKHASCAYLLRGMQDVDLRVVHLVRNSLGVAHSATKKVVKPEVVDRRTYMPMSHPGSVGLRYLTYNLAFELLGSLEVPSMFLKYEDFVADPTSTLTSIAELMDVALPPGSLDFVSGTALNLNANHTIAGNPMRFDAGSVHLRIDDKWRADMRPRHRAIVRAITWPLLLRYRYLGNASKQGNR